MTSRCHYHTVACLSELFVFDLLGFLATGWRGEGKTRKEAENCLLLLLVHWNSWQGGVLKSNIKQCKNAHQNGQKKQRPFWRESCHLGSSLESSYYWNGHWTLTPDICNWELNSIKRKEPRKWLWQWNQSSASFFVCSPLDPCSVIQLEKRGIVMNFRYVLMTWIRKAGMRSLDAGIKAILMIIFIIKGQNAKKTQPFMLWLIHEWETDIC